MYNVNYKQYDRGNIISATSAKMTNELLQTSISSSFADEYQDKRIIKEHPSYYTLGRLLTEAIPNSEKQFTQYPVDDKRCRQIALSIFKDNLCLYSDPKIAVLDNRLYIIGGRHRLLAIASTFVQIARLVVGKIDTILLEQNVDQEFNDMLELYIRCEVVAVRNIETILEMLVADNQTRTIRASEATHLHAQLLGASSDDINEPAKVALVSSGLSPSKRVTLAAQNFTRREYNRLTPETRYKVGCFITKFVIYGTVDKVTSNTEPIISELSQFEERMNEAWQHLIDIVESETTITNFARNVRELSLRVIKRMVDTTDEESKTNDEQLDEITEVVTAKKRGRPRKQVEVSPF